VKTYPTTGLLRLNQIIRPGGPLPISRSAWWEGVRAGRYPPKIKLGPKISAWRAEDILALVERGATGLATRSSGGRS
jgi:prophage regulatory protein